MINLIITGIRKNGQKKITRERKEIFPGYEEIVQNRQNMTGEEAGKQREDDNDNNDASGDDEVVVSFIIGKQILFYL